MGITGLLPFVKNSCRPAKLKDFSGATVAIDAYSWLHKGAFSCAEKLVKGEKTDGYVFYCMKLLNMILESGLKPIMVFDGCNLKSKEGTEKKRRENRERTRQRGKELLCEGKIKEARECFQRCVDVTPEMAREVILACRKKSVDCIVAPYEADAQLAYLDKTGIAQIIITEDSDLVIFGCNRILFKMDNCGGGLLYEKENLPKSFGARASKFSFEKFRYMCILSGCDYLPSLPGIGLQKACKFFSLTDNMDLNSVLSKLPSYLKMPKLTVTDEYKKSFVKANNTFLYQLVYCPKKKCLVPLNPYPEDLDKKDMEYAGKYLPNDLAHQLAMGNINIKTMKEFPSDNSEACSHMVVGKSFVWDSEASFSQKEPAKPELSAFKFNTPKQSLSTPQKRRFDEGIFSEMPSTDEELFSMYRGPSPKKLHSDSDLLEEDPLYVEPDVVDLSQDPIEETPSTPISQSPKLPFRKIVRSRFFSSSKTSSDSLKSPETPSDNKDNSCSLSTSCTWPLVLDSNNEDSFLASIDSSPLKDKNYSTNLDLSSLSSCSPKKANKENIRNIFAKKKPSDLPSTSPLIKELKISPTKSASLIDILDCDTDPCTLSSSGLSSKHLNSGDTSVSTPKQKTKRLISAKLSRFNWKKETKMGLRNPEPKLNLSQCSDATSADEGFESGRFIDLDDSEELEYLDTNKSSQKDEDKPVETSPYFGGAKFEVLTLSDSDDCDSPPVVESSKILKPIDNKSIKPGKCRTLGLSKNKNPSKASRKETLLNFNFVRQRKSDIATVI